MKKITKRGFKVGKYYYGMSCVRRWVIGVRKIVISRGRHDIFVGESWRTNWEDIFVKNPYHDDEVIDFGLVKVMEVKFYELTTEEAEKIKLKIIESQI